MATEPSSRIVIDARLEQLPALTRWVAALGAEVPLPASLVQRIDLCLSELVTNVIGYGYPAGQVGTVSVLFWRQPGHVVIRMDDDGMPFDPTSYVPIGLPGSLADAAIGGRGIRLVRHFADELHHRREAAGNQLTLVFRSPELGGLVPEGSAVAAAKR